MKRFLVIAACFAGFGLLFSCNQIGQNVCVKELEVDYHDHDLSKEEKKKYARWIDSLEAYPYQLRVWNVRENDVYLSHNIIFSVELFWNGLRDFTAVDGSVVAKVDLNKTAFHSTTATILDTLGLTKTSPSINAQQAANTAHGLLNQTRCYTAQLGYVNLRFDFNYIGGAHFSVQPDYVLAWMIRPKGPNDFMYAFVNAETGEVITYQKHVYD